MNTPANTNTASPSAPAGSGVDWESRYRADDTPWDKGRAHPALVDWLRRHPLTGRILVPGCGSGHDVRAIAASGAHDVVGLDLAPSAIQRADAFPRIGPERYELGDFLSGAAPGPFDALFEHTCFCAIDPSARFAYAAAAAAAVRPGGDFLAIFYADPGRESGPPFGCTREELHQLFAPGFELIEEQTAIPTFEGREDREWLRFYRRRASRP